MLTRINFYEQKVNELVNLSMLNAFCLLTAHKSYRNRSSVSILLASLRAFFTPINPTHLRDASQNQRETHGRPLDFDLAVKIGSKIQKPHFLKYGNKHLWTEKT
jgi:hypothetical protein